MANGVSRKPCLFTDLGKHAKDLLQKGYSTAHMLLFWHVTTSGTTLSTTAMMTEGVTVGTVSSTFKKSGVQTNLSFSTLNQLTAGTTYEDLAPGLKISLTTTIPNASNVGKAELIYQHDCAAITTTVKGLKSTPCLECTVNFGSENMSFGGSMEYDTANNVVLNTVAGLGYTAPRISAALLYSPKGENSIRAYCSQELRYNVLWGMHAEYQIEKKATMATIGGLYKIDSLTTVKARVNTSGTVSALLQYEPQPSVTVGLCAEVNYRSLKMEKPKIGFSLSVLSA